MAKLGPVDNFTAYIYIYICIHIHIASTVATALEPGNAPGTFSRPQPRHCINYWTNPCVHDLYSFLPALASDKKHGFTHAKFHRLSRLILGDTHIGGITTGGVHESAGLHKFIQFYLACHSGRQKNLNPWSTQEYTMCKRRSFSQAQAGKGPPKEDPSTSGLRVSFCSSSSLIPICSCFPVSYRCQKQQFWRVFIRMSSSPKVLDLDGYFKSEKPYHDHGDYLVWTGPRESVSVTIVSSGLPNPWLHSIGIWGNFRIFGNVGGRMAELQLFWNSVILVCIMVWQGVTIVPGLQKFLLYASDLIDSWPLSALICLPFCNAKS